MDEDGLGMEDEREIIIYGYINKKGKVVGQFREPYFGDWEYDYRRQAENNERTGVVEGGAYVVSEEKKDRRYARRQECHDRNSVKNFENG